MRKYKELLGGRFRLTKVVVRFDHKDDDDGKYQTLFEIF